MIDLQVLNNAGHIGFIPSCDSCKKPINHLSDANVVFETDYRRGPIREYLLVHKVCDRRQLRLSKDLTDAVAALQVGVQQ